MANHASALKRARQSEIRRLRNKTYKTRVKGAVKDVRSALDSGATSNLEETFRSAVSIIQKTAGKGIIHRKKAARKVARLARRVQQVTAGQDASAA
ncbi:30S ribosomal protein S20 [uncultured Desulfatiglans sp.]|nr:30S ribosomal protein S20 [uncultured Desulfatiglans sp.]